MVGFEDPVLSTGEDAIQTELFKRTAANDRQMLSEKSKTRLLSKEEQKQQWQDELLALSLDTQHKPPTVRSGMELLPRAFRPILNTC